MNDGIVFLGKNPSDLGVLFIALSAENIFPGLTSWNKPTSHIFGVVQKVLYKILTQKRSGMEDAIFNCTMTTFVSLSLVWGQMAKKPPNRFFGGCLPNCSLHLSLNYLVLDKDDKIHPNNNTTWIFSEGISFSTPSFTFLCFSKNNPGFTMLSFISLGCFQK